jgi:peroxiredoxin
LLKRLIFVAATLGLAMGGLYAQEFRNGEPVSEFTLRDMNGRSVNYSALKGNVTVVMFFSTRCPISNAFNYRRNALYKEFAGRVKFIVVDSNSNESLEEVGAYARGVEFDFPVYKDIDNVVADRFGAQITTDTFVMDSLGVIRYHGYLEDSPNPTRAKTKGLRLAVEAVLENKPVAMPEAKALGCSIRRVRPSL